MAKGLFLYGIWPWPVAAGVLPLHLISPVALAIALAVSDADQGRNKRFRMESGHRPSQFVSQRWI